jgi:predicted nucleic acid-binding protein
MTALPRVYVDTNALIYYAELHPVLGPSAKALLDGAVQRKIVIITSELSLAEALVLPFRTVRQALVSAYGRLLTTRPGFGVWPVTRDVLVACARLRAGQKIKTLDGLHIVTGLAAHCTHFVSEDSFPVPPPMLKLLPTRAIAGQRLDA